MRIIELESELAAAHEEVDRLRDQAAAPSQEKENEIYALDRRATLSETKNKGANEIHKPTPETNRLFKTWLVHHSDEGSLLNSPRRVL